MRHHAFPDGVTREGLLAWFRANRARTRQLFDLVDPDAYYDRPIALRNPIVFYEGHLPGFSVNTLVKLAHGRKGVDERLETLFARGIDPEDETAVRSPTDVWPSRDAVQRFAADCDALVEEALLKLPLEDEDVPQLRNGEAVFTILEHELMHQETLLYMLHALPHEKKKATFPAEWHIGPIGPIGPIRRSTIPPGTVTLGLERGTTFGWDNELPHHAVSVDEFTIDAYNVTNGEYLEFMQATGAAAPHFWERGEKEWYWRGMFALEPLDLHAPVYVTHVEAEAYARWKGKRLPTEAELTRASEGTEGGNYDFVSLDPVPVGQFAPSGWGVYDLVGNGWEWTSTLFAGFPGFEAMPSYELYSVDFFDGAHYVLKGASPVTARELVRPSFRNWFRPNYPYVYATFRLVDQGARCAI